MFRCKLSLRILKMYTHTVYTI